MTVLNQPPRWGLVASRVFTVAIFLLTLLMATQALAEQVWPGSVSVLDRHGRLLYTQDWLTARSDGHLSQWDILYRSPQGEVLGRRSLQFSPQAAYQPQIRLELQRGDSLQLYRDERWVRDYQKADRPREKRSWPDIRQRSVIDVALLRYLVEQREDLLSGEITQISHFRLDSGRARQFDVEVRQQPGPGGQELRINLSRKGWLSRRASYLDLTLLRSSGQIKQLQMTQGELAPVAPGEPVIMRFHY